MRILIADDEAESRAKVKRAFGTNGREDTLWEAEDGEEAVCLSRALIPDLVLMALTLPRIDGLEALRLIKEKNPEIQVIMLSRFDGDIYRRAAIQNGADGFIAKAETSMAPTRIEEGMVSFATDA